MSARQAVVYPKQCARCPAHFLATGPNAKHCPRCAPLARREYHRAWKRRKYGVEVEPSIPVTPRRPYIVDPRFLLILPEARAELARMDGRTPNLSVDRDTATDLASPHGRTGG